MRVKDIVLSAYLIVSAVRLLPHLVMMHLSSSLRVIEADLSRWSHVLKKKDLSSGSDRVRFFVWVMTIHPEYRNLFYHRVGWVGKILTPLCHPLPTLYIATEDIGPGLFINHGFSTIIAAKRVGSNCWINHDVTIGYSNQYDSPVLGDNVRVTSGAKVIGSIVLGNNCVVGANAVVVRDVPENCTVVGIPAYVVRKDGIRVMRKS